MVMNMDILLSALIYTKEVGLDFSLGPYIISHLDLARADTIMGGMRCEMLWLMCNFYHYYERIFIAQ